MKAVLSLFNVFLTKIYQKYHKRMTGTVTYVIMVRESGTAVKNRTAKERT